MRGSLAQTATQCRSPMKALVKKEPKEGLSLEPVPEPQPGPSDVLIKISHTGICGNRSAFTMGRMGQQNGAHPDGRRA